MLIIWGKKMGSILQKKSREKLRILRYPLDLKKNSNTFENITIYKLSRRAWIAAAWENSSSSSAKRIICSPWLCRRSAE